MSNAVIRCTVTDLDAFRAWRDDEESELPELLARLRGKVEPTVNMLAGRAFHRALELAWEDEIDTLEADGFTFSSPADISIPLSTCREVAVDGIYSTPVGDVHVRGRVDEINGVEVVDHKSTDRMDADRLLSSYQWRLYLDMLSASVFRWNVFEIQPSKDDDHHYVIRGMHRITQYRYPEMSEDVTRLCEQFAEVAIAHLPERVFRAA